MLVFVNNHFEGCAPLTAQRLAQAREKQARADAAKAALAAPATVACEDDGWRWNPLKKKDEACGERR